MLARLSTSAPPPLFEPHVCIFFSGLGGVDSGLWSVECGHIKRSHVKKGPLTTVNFFTTGHWGPLWSQRKTGLLFSGYFSKF